MGAAQQAQIFKVLHHIANGGGADLFVHCAGQGAAAHRIAALQIALDHAAKHLARALVQLVNNLGAVLLHYVPSRTALKTVGLKGQSGLRITSSRLYPEGNG
jgi:hypothetical protein